MNKKLNTVYFLLGATVLNLLIMLVLMSLLALIFILAYRNMEEVSQGLSLLAVLVVLIGGIAGTFFIYNRTIKWIVAKWKMDDYIEPLFRQSRKR